MPSPALPITLRQMRYLIALEETGHFRLAAERCGISQPSLSVQIKTLEDALDLQLVERGRGSIRLTLPGREVVMRAREVLDLAQGILDLSVTLKSGIGGTVRLGTSATLGPYLMPNVVADLHRSHPDLRLYIREGIPRDLQRELNDGTHDLILTQLPVVGASIVTARLFRENLSVALPVDHPLTEKAMIDPSDLAEQTILSLSPIYALHDQISAMCLETGATLSREYEGTSLDALRQMVAMGMGATILPALYVRSEIEGRARDVVVRPFNNRRFSRSIGLAWRKSSGAGPVYERIASLIRENVRNIPELIVES